MEHIGYGKGYQYAHNAEEKVTNMTCLPDSLRDRVYYHPTDQGVEARIRQRLDEIRRIKSKPPESKPKGSSGHGNRSKCESPQEQKLDHKKESNS